MTGIHKVDTGFFRVAKDEDLKDEKDGRKTSSRWEIG